MGVHANITAYGWLKPTLTVELEAGGSLLADTTYYVVGVMGYAPFTYGFQGGAISDIHEIVTTSVNKSIKVTHKTYRDITAFADNGDSRTLITSVMHCVTDAVMGDDADEIKIATGSYAGTWTVDEWVDYDTFIINTAYVDNVPVQFYTDSQYYNRPLLGGNGNQGLAVYISTDHPIDNDGLFKNGAANSFWDRRPYTAPDGGFANPKIYTAQPAFPLARYSTHPVLARMNVGPYKSLDDYGSIHIDIDGNVDFVDIYNEVKVAGFEAACGYSKGGYNTKPQFFLYGSIRAGSNTFLYESGVSITAFGEIASIVNEYEDITFNECVINNPSSNYSIFHCYTAPGSIYYNTASSNSYQGWIRGEDMTIYAAPRFTQTHGDGFGSYTNLYDMSSQSFAYVDDKLFKECGFALLLQPSYNRNVFRRGKFTPFYWIMNGTTEPDIYMMEDCEIKHSYGYTWHFRFYSYTPTADMSILRFLNIDNLDNADNHKDTIHNSALNLTAEFYRSVEITVQNSDGELLDGALVKITDNASNEYEDTTVDGVVSFEVIEQKDVMLETEPAYTPPTVTIYSDFVITIEKNTYQTYQETNEQLYQDTVKTIALQPSVEYVEGLINADVEEEELYGFSEQEYVDGVVTTDTIVASVSSI